jgi:serine/threonine protein kinase
MGLSIDCLGDDAILEFVEKKLAPAAEQQIHDHISTCPACRQLVAEAGKYYYEGQSHAETLTVSARMRSSELAPGQVIGRYSILSTIGRGGMGIVYEAYDPQLRRRIALKLLRDDPDDDAGAHARKTRLLREAQAMAQLSDPNVVSVFDAGELDGHVYIAMELVAGVTLDDWRIATARSIGEIVAVFEQAARGLAAAHAAGLVHRDFKPQNVLVGNDGRVRVTDFGLARETTAAADEFPAGTPAPVVDAMTRTGTLCGTPAYMAPEQFERRVADAISDQFNFCVAFYEALYGERPFRGTTIYELAHQVLEGRIEPPRDARVPADVRTIVMRGLRGSREERFPSMTRLIEELARIERAPIPRSRAASRIAVAIAGLGVVATVAWFATQHETKPSVAPAAARTAGSSASPSGSASPTLAAPAVTTPATAAPVGEPPPPATEARAKPAKKPAPPPRVRAKIPARAPERSEPRSRGDALKPLEED